MISICIATYNGEKYIKEQVDSILCQLDIQDEIIISDDSSTDNTILLLESYKDNRIKIIKNNDFKDPIFNFENCLKHATGDYIFLCDQDDVWHSDKIIKMLPFINKDNVVMCNANIADENLNIIKTLDDWRIYKHGFLPNIIKSRYIGCSMAFHRNYLDYILPFPKRIKGHDIWIGLLAELNKGIIYIPEPLMDYRRHNSNYSSVSEESKKSFINMFSYRLYFIFATTKRIIKHIILNKQ